MPFATEKQLKLIGMIEKNLGIQFNGYSISDAQKFISENIDDMNEKIKRNRIFSRCSGCYRRNYERRRPYNRDEYPDEWSPGSRYGTNYCDYDKDFFYD